jgi:hypothetical protein
VAGDDALHDLQPEPRARPGAFVVKNGSKTRASTSGAIPGPASVTSTSSPSRPSGSGSARVTTPERAAAHRGQRVGGVVEQVGPDLAQLRAVLLERREGAVVAARQLHACLAQLRARAS